MSDSILEVARRADLFFMEKSPIHDAMRRLTKTLRGMEIPFAIAGAMAANAHGHKQTTDDVNVLIGLQDLQRFKAQHIGHGWIDKHEGSKSFHDTVNDVNIGVLIAGEFPGDGRPKPVAFPMPEAVTVFLGEGIPYVSLPTLLELKTACAMTTSHRPRDLDDVIQLIRANKLTLEYADQLNPYVQDKYRELWQAAQVDEEY
ncbi:MAG: hypothetical protein H6823_19525 [Planctomycetaceae bacterium]|nr:hypothetical protein [Planctomycetaceae bacterium]